MSGRAGGEWDLDIIGLLGAEPLDVFPKLSEWARNIQRASGRCPE